MILSVILGVIVLWLAADGVNQARRMDGLEARIRDIEDEPYCNCACNDDDGR